LGCAATLATNESFRLRFSEAEEASALLLAGTDVGSPFPLVPGFSLHEELALLVEAGLSPLRALRAATISPALYLGREVADLALLGGNPLDDIRNTQSILAVVTNGRDLSREDLDVVLKGVRAAAAK
jgi:imidazolonepropionase-like amidohydrolase